MSEMMTAVVNHGPNDYRLEQVPRPTVGAGEVLIRVEAAGICGSDGKCHAGSEMFWGGDDPWVKAPVIPGHEFFGTVVDLGDGAGDRHGLKIGDLAIAEQIYPCDRCRYCTRGQYWMCEVHDIYGFQRQVADGAWAETMKLGRRARVHRMPADMPRRAGVLVEPLACAIHAVERASVQLGDVVVLAGAGPIGLLMLTVLKLKHPGKIIVTDANPARLERATRLGADVTVDVREHDPAQIVKELTGGYGCDVFIEATGYPDAVVQGLDALRKLGRMVVFGVFGSPVTTDWSVIGDRKELDVLGAHLGPYSYPTAIDLLYRGVVDADEIVTHELPLSKFDDGLMMLRDGEGIKIMLLPQER
jgi:erythritol/L-threitol dehydrogenase